MAVWFAGTLTLAGDIRRTLSRGQPHSDVLSERVGRAVRISQVAGVSTLVSGLVLIFGLGGFGAISPRIHAGLTLSLVALVVEFVLLGPAVGKLERSLAKGVSDEARAIGKRFSALTGVLHLLRLVVLLVMVFKR